MIDEEKKYIDDEILFKQQKRLRSDNLTKRDSFRFSMSEKLKQFFMDRVNSI